MAYIYHKRKNADFWIKRWIKFLLDFCTRHNFFLKPKIDFGAAKPHPGIKETTLAAVQFVRSLPIAYEGSHGVALLEKLVKISILGFAQRSLAS